MYITLFERVSWLQSRLFLEALQQSFWNMYFMHFFRHIQYLYRCPAQYFSEKSFLSITWLWQQLHLKVMFLLFQDTENGFFMNVNDQVLCNFYSSFLVPAHSVATFIEWCTNCQNFLNKLFIQCFTQKLVLLSFYLNLNDCLPHFVFMVQSGFAFC